MLPGQDGVHVNAQENVRAGQVGLALSGGFSRREDVGAGEAAGGIKRGGG